MQQQRRGIVCPGALALDRVDAAAGWPRVRASYDSYGDANTFTYVSMPVQRERETRATISIMIMQRTVA